jgi:hypothetical protein
MGSTAYLAMPRGRSSVTGSAEGIVET